MNESPEQALQRISDQRAENLMRAHDEIDRLARLCEAKDADNKLLRALHKKFIGSNKVLAEKLSDTQAQIAMQAEALKDAWFFTGKGDVVKAHEYLTKTISATSETVAAWRAKETEPPPHNQEVQMNEEEVLKLAKEHGMLCNDNEELLAFANACEKIGMEKAAKICDEVMEPLVAKTIRDAIESDK